MRTVLGWLLLLLMMTSSVAPVTGRPSPRLLWVPLDSRPVNTYEVGLLAEAAGLRVALPPADALDWYASRRSDFPRLVAWLRESTRPGDTQVLYMNSLLTGGLIASRDPTFYGGLPERLKQLRAALRQMPPGRRIAVQVLPRAIPTQFRPDGSPNPDYAWRELMLERTAVRHRVALYGLPADLARLDRVEGQIADATRRRSEALLQQNALLLDALLGWVNEGLLSELIIGLDDAQRFGENKLLQEQVRVRAADLVAAGRVQIHYGADEIGFLLLAREAAGTAGVTPAFSLDYDRAEGGGRVLPYEAVPLAESVAQKVAFLGGRVEPGAPQRLFLHTAAWGEAPEPARDQVGRVAAAVAGGQTATLVDVTAAGARDARYLQALGAAVPLGAVGYSAWNTASNSVGTGLAMAAISQVRAAQGSTMEQARAFVAFQAVRYAYDLAYQSRREELRQWAVRQGIDPTRFGAGRARMQARLAMVAGPAAEALLDEALRHRAVRVGAERYQVCTVRVALAFPWDRLFEVAVRPEVRLAPTGRCGQGGL